MAITFVRGFKEEDVVGNEVLGIATPFVLWKEFIEDMGDVGAITITFPTLLSLFLTTRK